MLNPGIEAAVVTRPIPICLRVSGLVIFFPKLEIMEDTEFCPLFTALSCFAFIFASDCTCAICAFPSATVVAATISSGIFAARSIVAVCSRTPISETVAAAVAVRACNSAVWVSKYSSESLARCSSSNRSVSSPTCPPFVVANPVSANASGFCKTLGSSSLTMTPA